MIKKISLIALMLVIMPTIQASKLSRWLEQQDQKAQQREEEQRRQDLDFTDYDFRLQAQGNENSADKCRNYSFRSHKDPYKHGTFTVCYQ